MNHYITQDCRVASQHYRFDVEEDVLHGPGYDPGTPSVAHHRVGFPGRRLPVREDGAMETLHDVVEERHAQLIIDVLRGTRLVKHRVWSQQAHII